MPNFEARLTSFERQVTAIDGALIHRYGAKAMKVALMNIQNTLETSLQDMQRLSQYATRDQHEELKHTIVGRHMFANTALRRTVNQPKYPNFGFWFALVAQHKPEMDEMAKWFTKNHGTVPAPMEEEAFAELTLIYSRLYRTLQRVTGPLTNALLDEAKFRDPTAEELQRGFPQPVRPPTPPPQNPATPSEQDPPTAPVPGAEPAQVDTE